MKITLTHKRIGAGILAAAIAFTPVTLIAEGHDGHDDNYRDAAVVIRSLEQHQVTLPQLIQNAEEAGKGIAIGVEVEDDIALQGIEVILLRDNEIIRVNTSPLTGQVLNVGSPEIIHSAVARISKRYDTLKDAKTSLREAIATAEKAEQGIAYQAHVEEMDDWACYEILVISNGTQIRVIVDPETGRIVGRDTRSDKHHDDH